MWSIICWLSAIAMGLNCCPPPFESRVLMSVTRRSIFDELQKAIDFLDDCLVDITGSEQQEEEFQD